MPTIVEGDFEWDADKAEANLAKHGVGFEEAQLVFLDPFAYFSDDGGGTERMIVIGESSERVLCVVHVERGWRYRIISARPATRHERFLYIKGET